MQAKKTSLKQKLTAMIIAFAMILSTFTFVSTGSSFTADAAITEAFQNTSVSVPNGEFNESSGAAPRVPSSWTSAPLGNTPEGGTVNGVVDLSLSNITKDNALENLKLDGYDEFKHGISDHLTPFGKDDGKFEGSDSDALMINSNGSKVAYGYKSATLSLTSNSYYKISAWVKTGAFGSGTNDGASIKITGLKNPLVFSGIDTSSEEKTLINDYGWREYSFFIETSTMYNSSVEISLQLGNSYDYTDKYGNEQSEIYTTSGYAFFDHVTATQYSPIYFDDEISEINIEKSFANPDKADRNYFVNEDNTSIYYSESNAEFLAIDDNGNIMTPDDSGYTDKEIGSFDNGMKGWTVADGSFGGYSPTIGIFNGENSAIGIHNTVPYSPNGIDDRIFILSSWEYDNIAEPDKGYFRSEDVGYASDYFTIPRYKNYRVSTWVNTVNGKVASAAITGYNYKGENNDLSSPDYGKPQLLVQSDISGGNASNTTRNGWTELSFYIKGSAFADYKVRIELWLGQKDAPVGGVAMFDNVRIEEITAKEYTNYSSYSKRVTFDPGAETNEISNGFFDEIEEYDDYSVQPFAPTGWTLMTAGEDKTTGMSTFVYDADYRDWCVNGIVSSNANSYKYEKQDGSYLEGAISPKTNSISTIPSNVLMLKADESTNAPEGGVAVGYKSSAFAIAANTVQTITVNMKALDINGYGANIVLKNGNDVIASIEKIQDTSGYEDFLFCVQTGDTDLSEVYVEIWLGLYDRVNNLSKLSTGTLFVDNVVLKNESEGDTDASMLYLGYYLNYENELKQGLNPKYATYSSAKMDFNAFDRYSNETIKTAYGWTESRIASNDGDGAVTYGVFTADEYDKNANGDLPQGYKHEGAVNRHSLIIKNNSPASSRIKCDTKFNLKSNSYYVVTILAKVDIPTNQLAQDYKGAYIGIVDSEHAISDIKSTNTVESIYDTEADDQSYKAFKFYIKTADDITIEDDDEEEDDESTKTSDTADTIISFEFGIGGSAENKNEWAVGALMINDISFEICSNSEYDEVKKAIDNGGILTSRFNAIVNYADDGKEEEEDKKEEENISGNISGDNWYLYTTVILAVILIIVLVSVAVRRYAQKRRREKEEEPEATLSYDRRNTLVPQHNERAEEKDIVKLSDSDIYDSFDENENYEYVDDTIEVEETQTESPAPANETAEKVEETVEEIVEEVVAPETSNEMQEETAENATEEVDEEYTYSEEIIDFTPSEEKKKILEAQRAEAERIKAAKAEAKKRAEAERIKAETERRLASRTQNDWDRFDE